MIKYLTISGELLRVKKKRGFTLGIKLIIALLSLLTLKGTKETQSTDRFMADQIGVSANYVNKIIAYLASEKIIKLNREYGRRSISFTEGGKLFIYNHEKKGKDAKN